MHAALRAEGLLAPSSARFSVDKRCRLCNGLGSLLSCPLLVATLSFNPAQGPQTASRSADHELECRGRATMCTATGSTYCRSAAVHRTSTSLWLSDSYSCEFGFVCQWWLLSSSFQCGCGAFDLFSPFPKSNSASQYANDDGQRPTSIVDLTARVPCRFFYFRGARQLWTLYRQPFACELFWKRRKHQQTDIQNSNVSSSHSIVEQAVRIALLPVFGRSAASARSGAGAATFHSNGKYRYRPHTQSDVGNCWPCTDHTFLFSGRLFFFQFENWVDVFWHKNNPEEGRLILAPLQSRFCQKTPHYNSFEMPHFASELVFLAPLLSCSGALRLKSHSHNPTASCFFTVYFFWLIRVFLVPNKLQTTTTNSPELKFCCHLV